MWVANAVSPIGVESPEAIRVSDAINMDAQTTGAKAANFFAGFTSPAITVSTIVGHNFAKATDGQAQTLVSTYACRDAEVTARMNVGALCLRYDPASAKAIVLYAYLNGTVSVGVANNMNTTDANSAQPFARHSSAQSFSLSAFGWTASNSADTFTLGCSGLDVYAKWNGVEIYRYKEYLILDPGYCLIWSHPNGAGIGDLSVSYLQHSLIGSNRAKKVIDLRDVGPLKASLTTGSMSAGSNQLTLASATGFAVGDPIIVEIGGETGGGQRGTKGVGGTSPATSYATTSALNAAAPIDGTWAWAEDTGLVYYRQSGAWQNTYPVLNYTNKALPRALKATITAIAGNVLTLSATASVATTNATIHYDNINAFLPLTTSVANAVKPPGVTVKLPEGNYALGSALALTTPTGCTFTGAGKTLSKLFSPKGLVPVQLRSSSSLYLTIKDMSWEGNIKLGSDGMPYGFQMGTGDPTGAEDYPLTADFGLTTGMIVNDIAIRDIWRAAIAFSTGFNNRANRCTLYLEAPVVQYTQWYFSSNSGAEGDEFRDCEVLYCPSFCKAFESFSAINAKFINCGGYNVLCSSNSAGGTVYDSFHTDIYANSYFQQNAGYPGEPVMNINHNAYPGSPLNQMGGQIINPRIIQHAKINYLAGGSCQAAIKVVSGVGPWAITGQYGSDTAPYIANKGGYLEGPDWASGDYGNGPVGVLIESDNCTASGIRSVGATSNRTDVGYIWGNFMIRGTGNVVTNNIGDVFSTTQATMPPTLSGNRTNAGVSVP